MKRSWLALAAAAVLVMSACGGGGSGDSDIGAPGPASTMGGGHAMSGGAMADCTPAGSTVAVVASATKFNTACLATSANQPFTLTFDNRDSISHNIVILESHTATDVLFRAEIFTGPKTATFNVPALRPGTYAFHCEVHPALMTGTFVVK